MKVIIVEPEKQVVKRVIRVLHAIDSSIQVLSVVTDMELLQQRINVHPFPDLVLINHKLLGDVSKTIEAKLIITLHKNHLVYLAFRVSHLSYLRKYLLNTADLPVKQKEESLVTPAGNIPESMPAPYLQQAIKKRFLVTYQQKLLSIAVEEIAYFFSDNRFIFFRTYDNRKFLVEYRMDELENMLESPAFLPHQPFLYHCHQLYCRYLYLPRQPV
ncbi:LytR/AlgR family response regulator transcription factor [Ferruginibacter sp.]